MVGDGGPETQKQGSKQACSKHICSMSRLVGALLACTACAMNATGLNLQRLAKRRDGSAMLNVLGVILSTACGIVDMVSFSFAPQSFLAPFGALTLCINLVLAPFLHGDRIQPIDVLATTLVVLGVITCLSNNTVTPRSWSLDELLTLAPPISLLAWFEYHH